MYKICQVSQFVSIRYSAGFTARNCHTCLLITCDLHDYLLFPTRNASYEDVNVGLKTLLAVTTKMQKQHSESVVIFCTFRLLEFSSKQKRLFNLSKLDLIITTKMVKLSTEFLEGLQGLNV